MTASPARRLVVAAAAVCSILLPAATSSAQTRQVMVRDDGSGPEVMHFSMPDLHRLKKPDYIRDDLPTFYDKLDLVEPQKLVVQVLLEAYLKAFHALAEEALPASGDGPMMFMGGPGGGGGMVVGGLDDAAREALGDVHDMDIDVTGPGEVSVRIGVGSGGPPMNEGEGAAYTVVAESGDAGDGPAAGVVIAVDPAGDVELSEEDMKRLEEKAKEMLERVHEQMGEDGMFFGAQTPEDAEAVRDQMEQMKKRMEEMAERARVFAKARKTLARDFENNVQAQLSIEQLGHWPELERTLVRRKTLPLGRLDAERTDLLAILDSVAPTTREREDAIERLDAYEMTLHERLLERNAFLDEAEQKVDESIRKGDFDDAIKVVDKGARLRVAVRDTNRQHLDLIADALPEETADRFRERALKNFYPRVHRRTVAQRAFTTARRLADEDEPLLASIRSIESGYLVERRGLDEKIVKAILEHQPGEAKQAIEKLAALQAGTGDAGGFGMMHGNGPTHELMTRRNELDARYLEKLSGLFSPELREKLPKMPKKGSRSPVFIKRGSPK